MKKIKAIHHSEERYASLTIVGFHKNHKQNIELALKIIDKDKFPDVNIVFEDMKKSFEFLIEYHDDYDRKSGKLFDKILKKLNITDCL